MIFNITFNRTGKQRMLPMDYQYYISAWIYKVLGKADAGFAGFLHSEGYRDGAKSFKLFCFSPLNFGKPTLWKEKTLFEIHQENVTLSVSFYLPDAAERFIVGLFNNQQAYFGDRFNGIDLTVVQIERLPEAVVAPTVHYRALSPVVISARSEEARYARYLSPTDEGYALMVKNNLTQKWATIPGALMLPEPFDFEMVVTSQPKSKLVTMKPGTPQQSKVRGYVYEFDLTAPEALHQLIGSAGIGEKNSTGFGWCEVK